MPLSDYTANNPDSPFRDPVGGESGYINPAAMRAFAQEISDSLAAIDQEGGVLGRAAYTFSSNIAEPPTSGQIRLDSADQTQATKLWMSEMTGEGVDIANFVNALGSVARLYVQDKNDAASWREYDVTSLLDKGSYVEWVVTYEGGGAPLPNQDCRVVFLR